RTPYPEAERRRSDQPPDRRGAARQPAHRRKAPQQHRHETEPPRQPRPRQVRDQTSRRALTGRLRSSTTEEIADIRRVFSQTCVFTPPSASSTIPPTVEISRAKWHVR